MVTSDETGVCPEDDFDLYIAVTWKACGTQQKSLLIVSVYYDIIAHMSVGLVPNAMTLNDLEPT